MVYCTSRSVPWSHVILIYYTPETFILSRFLKLKTDNNFSKYTFLNDLLTRYGQIKLRLHMPFLYLFVLFNYHLFDIYISIYIIPVVCMYGCNYNAVRWRCEICNAVRWRALIDFVYKYYDVIVLAYILIFEKGTM